LLIKAAFGGLLALLASCAFASGVWFSTGNALYRVDPSSNQAFLVTSPGSTQGLVSDPNDGSVWVLVGSRILKFSESGVQVVDLNLQSLGF
jgi:hypothetical protein